MSELRIALVAEGPTDCITEQWEQVKQVCTQAEHFEQLMLAALESVQY